MTTGGVASVGMVVGVAAEDSPHSATEDSVRMGMATGERSLETGVGVASVCMVGVVSAAVRVGVAAGERSL